MIYFTSDLHFNHDREFIYKPRGFDLVGEMNSTIITNFNEIVTPDDDVYILGDLMLGGPNKLDDGLNLISELNGKLHLVRGNHDSDKRWAAYSTLPNVVEQSNAIYLKYKGFHFYMSHYPTITNNNDYDKPLNAHLLNLCGHSHCKNKYTDMDKGYIYHVELDCQDNMPVEINQIIRDFKNFIYLPLEEKNEITSMEA